MACAQQNIDERCFVGVITAAISIECDLKMSASSVSYCAEGLSLY